MGEKKKKKKEKRKNKNWEKLRKTKNLDIKTSAVENLSFNRFTTSPNPIIIV